MIHGKKLESARMRTSQIQHLAIFLPRHKLVIIADHISSIRSSIIYFGQNNDLNVDNLGIYWVESLQELFQRILSQVWPLLVSG